VKRDPWAPASPDEEPLPASARAGTMEQPLLTPVLPLQTVAPSRPAAGNKAPPPLTNVRALLHKNRLLKQRQWCSLSCGCCGCPPFFPVSLFCELLLPVALVLFLWWARDKCVSGGQCVDIKTAGWGGEVPGTAHHITDSTVCNPRAKMPDGTNVKCDPWTNHFMHTRSEFCPLSGSDRAWDTHSCGGGQSMGSGDFFDVMLRVAHDREFGTVIGLSVDEPAMLPRLETMREWIHANWYPRTCLYRDPERCHGGTSHDVGFGNVTKTFDSALSLEEYLGDKEYGSDPKKPQLLLGIHFNAIPGRGELGAKGRWEYTIRMNFTNAGRHHSDVPRTSGSTVHHLQRSLDMDDTVAYMKNGFIASQLLVDRYAIGQRLTEWDSPPKTRELLVANYYPLEGLFEDDPFLYQAAEPLRYIPNRVEAMGLPVAGFVADIFYALFPIVFPVFFMLTFLYTQKQVINELISEKETKVRESLRMLGMGNASLIGSWYITYAMIFAVLCTVFVFTASLRIFAYSSFSLLWVFFWVWCMSFVAFAYVCQAFFDTARTGGIIGMLLSFAQWVLYTGLTSSGALTATQLRMLFLLPNCAFCSGVTLLAQFEGASKGANWGNLFIDVDGNSMGLILGMLVLDTVLLTFLGWYFDHVLPKAYGATHRPWFCCMPSFWTMSVLDAQDPSYDDTSGYAQLQGEVSVEKSDAVEQPTRALKQQAADGKCVQTIGLRKVYPPREYIAANTRALAAVYACVLCQLGLEWCRYI
jgi:hypothetical protein